MVESHEKRASFYVINHHRPSYSEAYFKLCVRNDPHILLVCKKWHTLVSTFIPLKCKEWKERGLVFSENDNEIRATYTVSRMTQLEELQIYENPLTHIHNLIIQSLRETFIIDTEPEL